MRQQIANHSAIPRRATATSQYTVANQHRTGHQSGIHPEDQPYQSTELEEDDRYYQTRAPRSAIRYQTTEGNQVIQQGNRRFVIHEQPPPKKQKQKQKYWLLFVGIGMVVMVLSWLLVELAVSWWTSEQLNATYQYPHIYQADEVVGHSDSTDHPTHFIFENLRGQIIIIEFPGGDYAHARIYKGPSLLSDNADQIPVTAEFKDVNGDGKVDIILHIQDQHVVFLNDGSQFKEE